MIRCNTSWLIRIATVWMLLTGILGLVFNFINHDIATTDRAEAALILFGIFISLFFILLALKLLFTERSIVISNKRISYRSGKKVLEESLQDLISWEAIEPRSLRYGARYILLKFKSGSIEINAAEFTNFDKVLAYFVKHHKEKLQQTGSNWLKRDII